MKKAILFFVLTICSFVALKAQSNCAIRNVVGIACLEKTINSGPWQPNPVVMNAPSQTVLSATSVASQTKSVDFQASVSSSIQASLLGVINANAAVSASVNGQLSTQTSFQQTTTVPVDLVARQQARFVLKGLYYQFTAEYYNSSTKKWIPFTFDKLVKQGIFVEKRMQ